MSRAIIAIYVGLWLLLLTLCTGTTPRQAAPQRRKRTRVTVPTALARRWQRSYGVGLSVGRVRLVLKIEAGFQV